MYAILRWSVVEGRHAYTRDGMHARSPAPVRGFKEERKQADIPERSISAVQIIPKEVLQRYNKKNGEQNLIRLKEV